jgi:hypothetical protein
LGTLALVTPKAPPGALPTYQFTEIAPVSIPNLYSIAFNGSGTLYGTDGSALYSVSPATGSATLVGSLGSAIQGLAGGVGGIRFDASGDLLAVAYDENNTNSVDISEFWIVNPLTGAATFLATPLDAIGNPLIDLVPGLVNGTMYGSGFRALSCGAGCYQANGIDTYSFTSLGSATTLAGVGGFSPPVFAANVPSASGSGPGAAPECSSGILAGLGVAAIGLCRRFGAARHALSLRLSALPAR